MPVVDRAPVRERIRATLHRVRLDDGTKAQRADVIGGHAIIHDPDPPLSPMGHEGGIQVELFLAGNAKFGEIRCRDLDHVIARLAKLEDK